MGKKGLICFDLDNTLVNSEKAHVMAYNRALKKYGFEVCGFKKMVVLFGMPHFELMEKLSGSNNTDLVNKMCKEHDLFFVENGYKYVKVIPWVKNTLQKLRKSYDLAVLSNCPHKVMLKSFIKTGLNKDYFELIIGNDDVKYSKPRPDELLKAEKLLKHKANFMVGDSIYDIMAGKRANVKTIAVLSGRYSQNLLKKYNPDFIIKNIRKLLDIV